MPPTLGSSLFANGFTRSLYVDTNDIARRLTAVFNPNALGNPGESDANNFARYGFHFNQSKGSTVGERYSDEGAIAAINAGRVPGFGPVTALTDIDRFDLMYTTRDGQRAAYDVLVPSVPVPHPPPVPPPVDPPAPPAPPVPPVPPAPPTPPVPVPFTLTTRSRETVRMMPGWEQLGVARRVRLADLARELTAKLEAP